MPKIMQKIILFIEPNEDAWFTPAKIGDLFMNRFAVDEDTAFEVINVLELGKTSTKMSWPEDPEYSKFENERQEKGMGFLSMVCFLETLIVYF